MNATISKMFEQAQFLETKTYQLWKLYLSRKRYNQNVQKRIWDLMNLFHKIKNIIKYAEEKFPNEIKKQTHLLYLFSTLNPIDISFLVENIRCLALIQTEKIKNAFQELNSPKEKALFEELEEVWIPFKINVDFVNDFLSQDLSNLLKKFDCDLYKNYQEILKLCSNK